MYNPDGSAYIIDSENDSQSNVLDNINLTGKLSENSILKPRDTWKIISGSIPPNNPKIHSFRVVTSHDASVNVLEPNKISKPILMCFICKLSFGNTKSFLMHANNEHTLDLQESERNLLNREYSSAILQRNIDEKPQISFLEPLDYQKQMVHALGQSSNCISTTTTPPTSIHTSSASSTNTKSDVNTVPSTTLPSLSNSKHIGFMKASSTITTNDSSSMQSQSPTNALNLNFISELMQQHRNQTSNNIPASPSFSSLTNSESLKCPEHSFSFKEDIDCKNCEMMNINMRASSTLSKSPNMTPPRSSNMSPVANLPINIPQSNANASSASSSSSNGGATPTSASSFTIGACPEHINGRPLGVDCPR